LELIRVLTSEIFTIFGRKIVSSFTQIQFLRPCQNSGLLKYILE